ncbi:hypothetical protein Emed_005658 [Eimeria media]
MLKSGRMGALQADGGWWWGVPINKRASKLWSFTIAGFLLLHHLLLATVLLACTPQTSLAFEVLWKPLSPLEAPLYSSKTSALPLLLRGPPTGIRKSRLGLLPSALAAKGRPGGGGGVGPKKKTPQQQAHQKQQQMLGGFGKQKAAKKKAENAAAATAAAKGAPKGPPTPRLTRKSGVKTEEESQDIQGADLSARDLPYGLVSPEVFEVYKLFGRLGDPLIPGSSLPPSRRLFIERLFKGYTRCSPMMSLLSLLFLLSLLSLSPAADGFVCCAVSLLSIRYCDRVYALRGMLEGLSEDQFRLRLEYDWRFLLPLPRDPLAPPGVCTGASTGPLFEGLDLKLCKAWAAVRKLPLKTEEPHTRRQPTKVMRRRTAFLWMYSRVYPPHLESSEGAKALQPPEGLPTDEVQLQEARRRVSSEINQQGLHPATLETLWDFLTEGKTILDRAQAERKFDELIGQDPGGSLPPLWIDASEVPGLLGGGKKGAVKSESLQIKHIFPRGGRLMFRNPEAVSLRGSKPNPRGLPLRLSLQRLWDLLGTEITQRMQAFDWAAYDALEAEVLAERQAFLSSLRKTIAFRQQRRRFCLESQRLLDGMWLSVLHSRNSRTAQSEPLSEEAHLLKIHQKSRRPPAERRASLAAQSRSFSKRID